MPRRLWSLLLGSSLLALAGCAERFDFSVIDATDTDDTSVSDDADVADTDVADTGDADAGECAEVCIESTTRCWEGDLETCELDEDGCPQWSEGVSCGEATCDAGACVCPGEDEVFFDGLCVVEGGPGSACLCDEDCAELGGVAPVCVDTVCMLLPETECATDPCPDGTLCQEFGTRSLPLCVPLVESFPCSGEDNGGRCIAAPEDLCDGTCCSVNTDCPDHSTRSGPLSCTCDPGYEVGDGGCVCRTTCEAGETRCPNTRSYQVCEADPEDDTCAAWSDAVDCDEGLTCSDGVCGCSHACEVGERRCVDETTVEVCVADDPCPSWQATPCSGEDDVRVCEAGECVCAPEFARTCNEATSTISVVDGCGTIGDPLVVCDTGCDPSDDICTPTPGFTRIPGGTFTMGTPDAEPFSNINERPRYDVTFSGAWWIGTSEVTLIQWTTLYPEQATGGLRPHTQTCTSSACPVTNVTWFAALQYANDLSADEGFTPCYALTDCTGDEDGLSCTGASLQECNGFMLPSEALWEYAARAGTESAFYSGAIVDGTSDTNADAIATYNTSQPSTVAAHNANSWLLYDTSGNAAEWTSTFFGTYPDEPVVDPPNFDSLATGVDFGAIVVRGGAYDDPSRSIRSGARATATTAASDRIGFRLVRLAPDP